MGRAIRTAREAARAVRAHRSVSDGDFRHFIYRTSAADFYSVKQVPPPKRYSPSVESGDPLLWEPRSHSEQILQIRVHRNLIARALKQQDSKGISFARYFLFQANSSAINLALRSAIHTTTMKWGFHPLRQFAQR